MTAKDQSKFGGKAEFRTQVSHPSLSPEPCYHLFSPRAERNVSCIDISLEGCLASFWLLPHFLAGMSLLKSSSEGLCVLQQHID